MCVIYWLYNEYTCCSTKYLERLDVSNIDGNCFYYIHRVMLNKFHTYNNACIWKCLIKVSCAESFISFNSTYISYDW